MKKDKQSYAFNRLAFMREENGKELLRLLTPTAKARENYERIMELIEKHADLEQIDAQYQATPLLICARKMASAPEYADIALRLIKAGADLHVKNHHHTVLDFFFEHGAPIEVIEEVLKRGAVYNKDHRASCNTQYNAQAIGMPYMHLAVMSKNIESIDFLIQKGASVNVADGGGTTVLMIAVNEDAVPVIEKILSLNPDMNEQDVAGATVLHYACTKIAPSSTAVIARLIMAGADPEIRDHAGIKPLENLSPRQRSNLTRSLTKLHREKENRIRALSNPALKKSITVPKKIKFKGTP